MLSLQESRSPVIIITICLSVKGTGRLLRCKESIFPWKETGQLKSPTFQGIEVKTVTSFTVWKSRSQRLLGRTPRCPGAIQPKNGLRSKVQKELDWRERHKPSMLISPSWGAGHHFSKERITDSLPSPQSKHLGEILPSQLNQRIHAITQDRGRGEWFYLTFFFFPEQTEQIIFDRTDLKVIYHRNCLHYSRQN